MLRTTTSLLALVFLLTGCGLFGGGGGGGGGTGGGSGATFTFNSGFTYVRKDDRNVYLVDATDYQTPAVLTTGGGVWSPVFSKDARRVVYVHKTGTDTELLSVPVGGGTPSTLLRSTSLAKNFRNPAVSPDGARVAFGYDEGLVAAVGLVNVDGSGFVKLVGGGSLAYGSPTFSPDGTRVLTAAGTPGLAFTQVEWVDVTTAQPTPISNQLGNTLGIASRVVLSPDGTRAAFDGQLPSGTTRIFVIDLVTKVVTKVNEYVAGASVNDSAPCWVGISAVAFSSDFGGNDSVYKVGISGTGSPELLVPKALEPWYGP